MGAGTGRGERSPGPATKLACEVVSVHVLAHVHTCSYIDYGGMNTGVEKMKLSAGAAAAPAPAAEGPTMGRLKDP